MHHRISNPELPRNISTSATSFPHPSRPSIPHADFETLTRTFTTSPDANTAALRLFRSDIEGHAVEGVAENVKDDGTLLCKAQSPGQADIAGLWRLCVLLGRRLFIRYGTIE